MKKTVAKISDTECKETIIIKVEPVDVPIEYDGPRSEEMCCIEEGGTGEELRQRNNSTDAVSVKGEECGEAERPDYGMDIGADIQQESLLTAEAACTAGGSGLRYTSLTNLGVSSSSSLNLQHSTIHQVLNDSGKSSKLSKSLPSHLLLYTIKKSNVSQNDSSSASKKMQIQQKTRKSYRCEKCSKTFTHSTNLNQHMRAHRNEKSRICQLCGKYFTRISNFHAHMHMHTGDKPHLCKMCGKSFTRLDNMQAHMRIHAGKESLNAKKKKKRQKMVQNSCEMTCCYNCSEKFSDQMREQINVLFCSLSDAQKYKYYNEHTKRIQVLRKRTRSENSRRKYSFIYHLPYLNDKRRVCKEFFCTTLDISVQRIYHFYKRKDTCSPTIIPTPQKGKYIKKQTHPDKIEEVANHIKSFPIQESHYCKTSTKRQYLDPLLSIMKMYFLYVETHKDPVKENIYRKVFNEKFNLGFHRPKKDVCDICCEFNAILNPDENQRHIFDDHMFQKMEGDEEREKDRLINPKNTSTAVLTFGFENIFYLPKANISCFYYVSKLAMYNLMGHCNVGNTATNAVWDETKNGQNDDDIASALIKILISVVKNLPSNISKLILWSDSCVPENKNSYMSMALVNFLQTENAKNITEIEQKFYEPGHGNSREIDSVHSIIERHLKHQEIYSPLGLMRSLMKIQSKHTFNFLQMLETDFHSFHEEAVKLGFGQIPYTKIKSIKYNKFNWNIVEYKTSFTKSAVLIDINQNPINILSEVIINKPTHNLSDKQINDIRSVYNYMPTEDKLYMETLIKKAIKDKKETDENELNDYTK